MNNNIKILIIGNIRGHNRAEWVSHMLARADMEIRFDVRYSSFRGSTDPALNTIKRKIFNWFISPIVDLFQAKQTKLVYVPPMNWPSMKYARWIADRLSAKLIVDYYVCGMTTLEETNSDRCWIGDRKECLAYDTFALTKTDVLIHPCLSEIKATEKLLGKSFLLNNLKIMPLSLEKYPMVWQYEKREKLHLIWWALFSKLHGVEYFLQTIATIPSSQRRQLRMTFAGTSQCIEYLEKVISEANLSDFEIEIRTDLNMASGSLQNYVCRECDLAVGNFGASIKAQNVFYNKFVESAAFEIPLITSDTVAAREFFKDEDAILVKNKPEELPKKLLELINNRELLKDYSKNIRQCYDLFFDRTIFQKKFRDLLISKNY